MPARFAAAFTTCQIAFGVSPAPQSLPIRLTRRKIVPVRFRRPRSSSRQRVSPKPGPGRFGYAFPCRSGLRLPSAPPGSENLAPRDRPIRRVAGHTQSKSLELPCHVWLGGPPPAVPSAGLLLAPLSANCHLTPSRFAPFTRRMPAASSGLRRPVSEASYASRRTAARRTLIVEGARVFCSRKNRYRRTTVRLNDNRGSEQYQPMNSSIA